MMEIVGGEHGFLRGPKVGGGFVTIPTRNILYCAAYGLDELGNG